MRVIDPAAWPRREHFAKFGGFQDPRFDIVAPVDVTRLRGALESRRERFSAAIVYLLMRAANELSEFRTRIRGDLIVEHDVVHPSFTVLAEGDRLGFCLVEYRPDFGAFAVDFAARVDAAKDAPTMSDPPGRDDLIFMTAIPWVSFTSFTHPMPTVPGDSFPRMAWGRVTRQGDRLVMPLEVQGHHGLMDGIHIARLYAGVQAGLDEPGGWLGRRV